jgi:SAM-dependent methyltransferase
MLKENNKSKTLSIMRAHQYEELNKVTLNGRVLDLGGSKRSGYQDLIKGNHEFVTVNLDESYGYDLKFNIEEKFPLEDSVFDNVLSMNLIEHIYDTHNIFSESARVLKTGGMFVSAVPYMHHVHGSPDDFVRYTDSAYRKFADKYGFEVVYMKPLGFGLFSLIFQTITIYRTLPFVWLFNVVKFIFVTIDKFLLNIAYYRKLADSIPLGYFWVMKKK